MWILAVIILMLSLILFTLVGGKISQLKKKWRVFKISAKAAAKIMFTVKTEERLQAFQKIHSLFPKFVHIDFLNIRVLLVYDPEVAKK